MAFFKQLTKSETHLIVILELGLLQPRAEVGQPPVGQAARGARGGGGGGGGAAGLGLGGHVARSRGLDTCWTGGPVLGGHYPTRLSCVCVSWTRVQSSCIIWIRVRNISWTRVSCSCVSYTRSIGSCVSWTRVS